MKNFTMIPNELFDDSRLKHRDFKVLAALYSFRRKGTRLVYPRRETLSRRTGISIENISRITTRLEALGHLTKEGKGGKSRATRYHLIDPSNNVDFDTVANHVGNGTVSPNHVMSDTGIEQTEHSNLGTTPVGMPQGALAPQRVPVDGCGADKIKEKS